MIDVDANEVKTVWIPSESLNPPPCYHGNPLQIVQEITKAFTCEDQSPVGAIRVLTEDLEVATGALVEFPKGLSADLKAAALVGLLIDSGLVREAAKA